MRDTLTRLRLNVDGELGPVWQQLCYLRCGGCAVALGNGIYSLFLLVWVSILTRDTMGISNCGIDGENIRKIGNKKKVNSINY